MAYIGNSPANVGNYQILDDISSSFNGSLTTFALTTSSVAITPTAAGQALISINGVIQEPDNAGTDGFKVSGNNVVFSSAPASGDTFWGVFQGSAVDIGIPSDDVVDTIHIKDDAVTTAKLANSINSAIAANTAKTGITTAQTNAITANTNAIGSGGSGITTAQSNAITANTSKVTNATHSGEVTGSGALTIANDAVTTAKLNLISTSSVPSLEARSDGTTDGYIQLNCTANTHGIKLKSPPHSAGASYTLTFPNDDGNSGQALTTNGSGVLTWAAGGGPSLGTASIIRTNAQTISENITISSTTNGMSAGPITIADTYTVTVNGNWSIV